MGQSVAARGHRLRLCFVGLGCDFDPEDMGKNYEPKEECVAPDSPVPERYRGKPLPKRRSALATSWLYRAQKKQDEEEAWQSWLHSFETGNALDRTSEKAMPRKMAAVARAVKEDNKNTTRARPFGDFEVPAGHTSSSLTLVSSRDDSPSSSVLRASKKKRGKDKKQKKAKTSKKAKKSKQRKAASSSQDTASPPSSHDTEHAPKERRRSALAESSKTKKTRTGISVKSDSEGSERLRGQVPDAGKDLCKTWSLSELQAFEEMAAQQVTAADNAALEVEQRLTVSKALPAELRKMVWERAGLLPSTENEEVLKANAERLVKHTFDGQTSASSLGTGCGAGGLQEDEHRSAARGQAVPPRDDGKAPRGRSCGMGGCPTGGLARKLAPACGASQGIVGRRRGSRQLQQSPDLRADVCHQGAQERQGLGSRELDSGHGGRRLRTSAAGEIRAPEAG